MELKEVLKKIGCTTDIVNVTEFFCEKEEKPGGFYEIYFRIYSEQGDVIGRIYNLLVDGKMKEVSKLDYRRSLKFCRNVNLQVETF